MPRARSTEHGAWSTKHAARSMEQGALCPEYVACSIMEQAALCMLHGAWGTRRCLRWSSAMPLGGGPELFTSL
ncbi:hypothetical protein [Paenibacillus sp. ATY16]|uniref:hypothetical protein n=1 Tax=Paenibacillus sp. ATY16 TaxID=1759312 RepID=UPI00200CACC7|nr:hypothetical protein [Paenibacillus sp. ATY16]MCK9863004.1 hypothetical protein [Paenibacillus sp. ATY16]